MDMVVFKYYFEKILQLGASVFAVVFALAWVHSLTTGSAESGAMADLLFTGVFLFVVTRVMFFGHKGLLED